MTQTKPIKIFVSYSQEDEDLRKELANHLEPLEREGVSTTWYEGNISAGTERDDEIQKHLNSSRVILLLISSDFNSSDKWNTEVTQALDKHKKKEALVIPVLLRECVIGKELRDLQALPDNDKFIQTWPEGKDAAFRKVVEGMQTAIEKINSELVKEQASKDVKSQKIKKLLWRNVFTIVPASIGLTFIVIVMRVFGILHTLEFPLFDLMMRSQFHEHPDDKLLIIQITPDDIKKYGQGKVNSLPDKIISDLLKKLVNLNSRVIGLDLYREFQAEDQDLKNILEKEPRLVAVCKVEDKISDSRGTAFPPELKNHEERIGFSDFVQDDHDVLRRQILQMDTNTNNLISPCRAHNQQGTIMDSFSFKLAQSYLRAKKKEYKNVGNGVTNLASGDVVLEGLDGLTGGYGASDDINGFQVLLNYRSVCQNQTGPFPQCSPHNIAPIISVEEALGSNLDKLKVENNIILIGTDIDGVDYRFPTPFKKPQMSGLIVQAQMVSQIVSAVLEPRPLLKVWSFWYEMLWMFAWSLIGGILTQFCLTKPRTKRSLIITGGIAFTSLYILCLVFFISPIKRWVPFVPPALTMVGTGGVVFIRFKAQKSF